MLFWVSGFDIIYALQDEEFDKNALKGRLAAETLKKPLTFFEAVEKIPLPKKESDEIGKGKKMKG